MGTKANPGRFDCYAAAHPTEEMFVLLERDRMAPALVELWARLRMQEGEDLYKVAEANGCASRMRAHFWDKGKMQYELMDLLKGFKTEELEAVLQRRKGT